MLDVDRNYFKFEWDDAKRASNLRKHGIDFPSATAVWSAPMVTELDDRFDYGEDRYQTLGLLDGRVVVVAHAETDQVIRIISMRYALKHEEARYHELTR